MSGKFRILVLAGGLSDEREVSLASARAITESLNRLGHRVSVIDSASGQSLLDGEGRYIFSKNEASNSKIALKASERTALANSISSEQYRDIDLVFLALHGGAGEDGTIQALLDLAGKKYTGSGVLASAVAMNKAFTKRILRGEGIPTPRWELFNIKSPADIEHGIATLAEHSGLKLPVIIKPNNSGSTIGLSLIRHDREIATALKKASEISREVLVEEYIKGREITASVLDGAALPLVEIIPTNELYDYQCKYTKGKSQYICPARISRTATEEIQELAKRAYKSIGCSGLARVDFILNNDQPYFLEINTLPGMTELSLAPMAAKTAGIDFDRLVERICGAALES